MATETIFFSYSRVDSDFVLKLATDLRDAGFDIWLDQLDITPGRRWDDSIQSALNDSKTPIVILSSSSSKNRLGTFPIIPHLHEIESRKLVDLHYFIRILPVF